VVGLALQLLRLRSLPGFQLLPALHGLHLPALPTQSAVSVVAAHGSPSRACYLRHTPHTGGSHPSVGVAAGFSRARRVVPGQPWCGVRLRAGGLRRGRAGRLRAGPGGARCQGPCQGGDRVVSGGLPIVDA
jgi:hypothetical protein